MPAATPDVWFTILVTLLALLPRLYVGLVWAKEPVWDGHYYHFGATRIAAGLGYSEDVVRNGIAVWKPWTHYPVGYSAFLAIFYAMLGPHAWVAPVVNALTGSALVSVVHRVAWPSLGRWRARIAAILTAIHPGLIVYSAVVMTEPLAALLALLAVYFIVRAPDRKSSLVCCALTLSAAVLVRPSTLAVVPLFAFLLPVSFWRAAASTASIGALCVLGVLPWTLRNCQRMDGCAFVSTNAGWNLAIGALTDTGRFRTLRAADGCPVVTGQVQQDRCWWDVGIQLIRHHPRHFMATAPLKLAQTFDHESFVIEYLHEADPGAWPESRRRLGRGFLSAWHRGLLIVALFCVVSAMWCRRDKVLAFVTQALLAAGLVIVAGLVIQSDEHPYYLAVIALCTLYWLPLPGYPRRIGLVQFAVGFIAVTALTHIVFFGEDRYHMVTSPLFCLCAAAILGQPHFRAGRTNRVQGCTS